MDVVVKITDEASKPADHVAKALQGIDKAVKTLTGDLKVLEGLLKSLSPAFKDVATTLGVATKELGVFDREGKATVSTLRHIEEAAKKTKTALSGIHGGGGGGREGGKRFEGLGGLVGGQLGSFFGTGPLGVLLGTASELGEAFSSLIDKVVEASSVQTEENNLLRAEGFSPEARQKIEERAHGIGVSREDLLHLALGAAGIEFNNKNPEAARLDFATNLLKVTGNNPLLADAIEKGITKGLLPEGKNKLPKGALLALSKLGDQEHKFAGTSPQQAVDFLAGLKTTYVSSAKDQKAILDERLDSVFEKSGPAIEKLYETLNKALSDRTLDKVAEGLSIILNQLADLASWLGKFVSPPPQVVGPPEPNPPDTPFQARARRALNYVFGDPTQQGTGSGSVPPTPSHDAGGVTLQDHKAFVHKNEVIMPISKAAGILTEVMSKSNGGGATNFAPAVTINVTTQPGQDTEQISRRVADLVPLVLNSAFEQMNLQRTGGIP